MSWVTFESLRPTPVTRLNPMRLPIVLPPASRAVDVVALGENSLDLLAVVAKGVPGGSKQSLEAFRIEPGGQMATAALGCAKLGLRSRYLGVFGDDEWSARARAPLDAAGVEVRAIRRTGIAGRIAVIVVDAAGDRTVFERRDAALVLAPADVDAEAIAGARVLLVDATQPEAARTALAIAREAGVVSVSDVDQVTPAADVVLAEVDLAVVPAPFVAAWSGTSDPDRGLQQLAGHCRRAAAVVVTDGPEGARAYCGGRTISSPGLVVDVVDTTGAGDAFRAGVAAALVYLGPNPDLADVLRFANVTGALNCRAVGAQAGLPTLDDVLVHVTAGLPGLSK